MIDIELVVPDGWVHLPTAPGTERVRARVIDAVVRHHVPDSLPRDSAEPWRRELRKQLLEATEEAAQQGARSVLLPLQPFQGLRLPGSLLLTVLEDDPTHDPEKLLASIIADAGDEGTYVEVGGSPAARVSAVIESDRIGRAASSLRVSYYVANLDEPGVWGLLTFTVLTDGDVESELVQAVVLVFDALVSTLRWADRADVPTEGEVLTWLGPTD